MLAAFCLRLALGMVAFLPLLPAKQMHPRFFRTQFLTALGLSVVALLAAWADTFASCRWLLVLAVSISLLATLDWTLDPAPFGKITCLLAILSLGIASIYITPFDRDPLFCAMDSIASALLLGASVTAMLVGHSYLISPGLAITPLITMLATLSFCLLLRILVLVLFWWALCWTESASMTWNAHWTILIPRYLIGLGGPLVFGTMAFLATRIRSTQSATGILFVVVICVFLGELMSLVLTRMAGWPL